MSAPLLKTDGSEGSPETRGPEPNHEKNKGFHYTKISFFTRENQLFDGLWGPWFAVDGLRTAEPNSFEPL